MWQLWLSSALNNHARSPLPNEHEGCTVDLRTGSPQQSRLVWTGATTLRKPNFFIIGAPKCGTTSLSVWLGEHRKIFMSPIKEPHFFNSDDRQAISVLDEYEALFCDASEEHIAIGEASVWYLSSANAVAAILRYQPEAKFIVMVRNPIEMAPALHGEMLLSGLEYEHEFPMAWNLQEERRQGRRIRVSWARRRFLYGEICSLGVQLQRLYKIVSPSRVLTIILDDIRADPRREYLRVLQFLDVPDDGRLDFPVYNPASALRYPGIQRAAYPILHLKDRLGVSGGLGLWTRMENLMRVESPRKPLTPEMIAVLNDYFSQDVKLLGQLLGRDLCQWLAVNRGTAPGRRDKSPASA
jgi:Sulfotransferase domain